MSDRNHMFGQLRPVILDMAHVRRAGLLSTEGAKVRIDVGLPLIVVHKNDTLLISVPKYNPALSLQYAFEDAKFWRRFEVEIVYRDLPFGSRPYFVCPVTGLDCLKLVIQDGLIGSKAAFKDLAHRHAFSREHLEFIDARRKLLKQDGSLRMTSLERERLIARIKKHPGRYRSDMALLEFLRRNEREEARKERKHLWESRALSTTKGLDRGRGIGQDLIFEEYSWRDPLWVDTLPPVALASDLQRDEIQNYPELDIKGLLQRADLEQTSLTGRSLGWPESATDGCTVYMFVDGRGGGLPKLVFAIHDRDAGEKEAFTWQAIRLLPAPNSTKPRYFLCPITHARCETLYLRNRVFASSQAQRLFKPKSWSLTPAA